MNDDEYCEHCRERYRKINLMMLLSGIMVGIVIGAASCAAILLCD